MIVGQIRTGEENLIEDEAGVDLGMLENLENEETRHIRVIKDGATTQEEAITTETINMKENKP
jgi:hypothetical protein